jgi:hypothetical protein
MTLAHKYDQQLSKCIGISFFKEGEYFLIDWCFLESPWTRNLEFEKILRKNLPFRDVKEY